MIVTVKKSPALVRKVFLLLILICGSNSSADTSSLVQDVSRSLGERNDDSLSQLVTRLSEEINANEASSETLTALDVLAQAHIRLGQKDEAFTVLNRAFGLIEQLPATTRTPEEIRKIAVGYRELGARRSARDTIQRSVQIAERQGTVIERIDLLSELAVLQAETEDFDNALITADKILGLLDEDDHEGIARTRVNRLKNLVHLSADIETINAELKLIKFRLSKIVLDKELLLDLSAVLLQAGLTNQFRSDISQFLDQVKTANLQSDNPRIGAFIHGYQAMISESDGEWQKALALTRKALKVSQENQLEELIYLWFWQIGRLQKSSGDYDVAVINYQRALQSVSAIRSDLLKTSYGIFKRRVLPVYAETIDLLLHQAQRATSTDLEQKYLQQVQQTIETFALVEVLEYFQDDCLLPRDQMTLSDVPANTAVIYPIISKDKLITLVKLPTGLHQYVTTVDQKILGREVRLFRESIEDLDGSEEDYHETGKQLFEWIISPLLEDLKKSQTKNLVFIPAPLLRTIPMAALYDGKKYLIEQFSIVTSLGLNLTDPHPFSLEKDALLFGGVSDAVQGFVALPGALREISEISATLGGETITNQAFTADYVSQRLAAGRYSLVHFATHGVFANEYSDSYLLAYDEKLTLDRMQSTIGKRRFLYNPLDLLVLSACETAIGDERAALGLAGVSLKAGARATVASLWYISDEATYRLMDRFYAGLAEGQPKADALQAAQLSLIEDPVFSHPNFWSPYLLIGNWL